ncbi:hypothetical protein [Dactylosporangium sp. CA-139066]|uniref:hypothetical protein n=1 Tax=Dactylosporangium sp. CA-139066 TaxID=3239930 RepID=UPI003D9483FA
MSSPNRKRYKLSELRQNAEAKNGSCIYFEAPDDTEYVIPAPGFWPDEVHEAMRSQDALKIAQALLGAKYADFVASGGRADDLGMVLESWASDQGADVPKS